MRFFVVQFCCMAAHMLRVCMLASHTAHLYTHEHDAMHACAQSGGNPIGQTPTTTLTTWRPGFGHASAMVMATAATQACHTRVSCTQPSNAHDKHTVRVHATMQRACPSTTTDSERQCLARQSCQLPSYSHAGAMHGAWCSMHATATCTWQGFNAASPYPQR